jgi:hypothetical protein
MPPANREAESLGNGVFAKLPALARSVQRDLPGSQTFQVDRGAPFAKIDRV